MELPDKIEEVNAKNLESLIEDSDYLAVLLYEENNEESEKILQGLENVDDEADAKDIGFVKIADENLATEYGLDKLPALVYYRKKIPLLYDGDLFNEEEVLNYLFEYKYLGDETDGIEDVSADSLIQLIEESPNLGVLFYDIENRNHQRILEELESIKNAINSNGIPLVKIYNQKLAGKLGINVFPSLVYFENKMPNFYQGDILKEEVLVWLIKQSKSNEVEDVADEVLPHMIEKTGENVALFYGDNDAENHIVLVNIENFSDDAARLGIPFVKINDTELAEDYGTETENSPTLVFFENQEQNYYKDNNAEEDDWPLSDTIETVNKATLEKWIEEAQYLAVFFYRPHCHACEVALLQLQKFADDTDLYGINVVKIYDPQVAKRYGIKTYPALVYFRNGHPLIFDGDIKNKESVLEWLIEDDNRALVDGIETVNLRMLNKLVEESPFLAVYFYMEDCHECKRVLTELENINDQCDVFGIDLVKTYDPGALKEYNVESVPILVFFRKQVPKFYEGDLYKEEELLKYLTSNDAFEIKDEIEEVNRKMLKKLLDENEFVSVFFYENNCQYCMDALKELEHIDDIADDLEILFVKIKDPRYAKKFGIASFPSLVYFRKKLPSIYRGNLLEEEEVLEWLRKNKYCHPELNLFMYGWAAISLAFVLYTIVLIKNKEKKE